MPLKWFKNIGPGPLIAAAFIGPGTVTVCTLAGVHFGYALLWAMMLSIVATILLQEMAARLGIVTQKGLSEIIRATLQNPLLKSLVLLLIFSAIVLGNAAYEAGNITGGALGLEALFGNMGGGIRRFCHENVQFAYWRMRFRPFVYGKLQKVGKDIDHYGHHHELLLFDNSRTTGPRHI